MANITPGLEARIQAMYDSHASLLGDVYAAVSWARDTLLNSEGSGHKFQVSATGDGEVCCSFAKPAWSGDHCGRAMGDGAQAIVMAVCEYMCGA